MAGRGQSVFVRDINVELATGSNVSLLFKGFCQPPLGKQMCLSIAESVKEVCIGGFSGGRRSI